DGTSWARNAAAGPSFGRYAFGIAFDAARKQTVLFGGFAPPGTFLGDTLLYDGVAWTMASAAASPGKRMRPAMAYDARRKVVVLCGGTDATLRNLTAT